MIVVRRAYEAAGLDFANHAVAITMPDSQLDRIAALHEHNRDRRGCRFGSNRSLGAAGGHNDCHFFPDKLGGKIWQFVVVIFCPAIFDGNVLTFYKTELAQPLFECCHTMPKASW
jgi:hypothetical protein